MKRREEEGGRTIKNDEGDVAPNENLYNYTGCGGDNCLNPLGPIADLSVQLM